MHAAYTRELDAAVTALGRSGELLEVLVDELATRSLHNPSAVGSGVVWRALAEGDALGHFAENQHLALQSSGEC